MQETTIQDCLDRFEEEMEATIVNDGAVVGFVKENPCKAASQCRE